MSASVLYMSMSLDGYIAWTADWNVRPGSATELHDEMNATGAVVAGRRTVKQVDHGNRVRR